MYAFDCRQRWGIELDKTQLVELDSSTPAKWSRHLIVRLAGCAFHNNGHMGRFVEALLYAPEVLYTMCKILNKHSVIISLVFKSVAIHQIIC